MTSTFAGRIRPIADAIRSRMMMSRSRDRRHLSFRTAAICLASRPPESSGRRCPRRGPAIGWRLMIGYPSQ